MNKMIADENDYSASCFFDSSEKSVFLRFVNVVGADSGASVYIWDRRTFLYLY